MSMLCSSITRKPGGSSMSTHPVTCIPLTVRDYYLAAADKSSCLLYFYSGILSLLSTKKNVYLAADIYPLGLGFLLGKVSTQLAQGEESMRHCVLERRVDLCVGLIVAIGLEYWIPSKARWSSCIHNFALLSTQAKERVCKFTSHGSVFFGGVN